MVKLLHKRGLDIGEHSSQQLQDLDILDADLLVTMERAHVRRITAMVPNAWNKAGTLHEFARLDQPNRSSLGISRIYSLLEKRSIRDYMNPNISDDVRDPTGGGRRGYRKLIEELDPLLDGLLRLIAHRDAPQS
jgi:protein-tyrosine-phosphatase